MGVEGPQKDAQWRALSVRSLRLHHESDHNTLTFDEPAVDMSGNDDVASQAYVLVTAAHNEQAVIEQTILSVARQCLPPRLWVIVSDASTDHTDEIVREYANEYSFIHFIRIQRGGTRNFGSKVNAVQAGFEVATQHDYAFIGNLDADLSFEEDYFSLLIQRFQNDALLGIAGGWICEDEGNGFKPRRFNSLQSVPHAVHLLRRGCYEDIGDYLPLRYGGEDTCAVVTARMRGWSTRTFPDLTVRHHRRTVSLRESFRNSTRRGLRDHALGYAPLYELLACLRRLRERPYLIGSILQLAGFCVGGRLRGESRLVSSEFISFLRTEQRRRMASLLRIESACQDDATRPARHADDASAARR